VAGIAAKVRRGAREFNDGGGLLLLMQWRGKEGGGERMTRGDSASVRERRRGLLRALVCLGG
jgi:hypothetical protein